MALNWTTIDTAIKVWLDTAAPSVTFYRGDQNIPRPALPVGEWTWSNVGGKLQAHLALLMRIKSRDNSVHCFCRIKSVQGG